MVLNIRTILGSSNIKRVCLDIETYDPDLRTKGPGFVYKDDRSFVVGVAVAWVQSGKIDSIYLPWRHREGTNISIEESKAFIFGLMDANTEFVGANIHYDLEGLRSDGLEFKNRPKRDIQIAEFLIDNTTSSYSLASLAIKYLPNQHKLTDELQKQAKAILGVGENAYLNMHNLPVNVVGPYACEDAELTLMVYEKQLPILQNEGLMEAFLLECDLIDYVQDVRWKGIRVDVDRAEQTFKELEIECNSHRRILEQISGSGELNIWSQKDIEKAADNLKLSFPRTLKDNASFVSGWLEKQKEPFWQHLYQTRVLDRGGSIFVKSKILDLVHNGRLYYQLSQVRGEDGGTVSSRFASRRPNMQQIPSRNAALSKKIRSLFLPEPGETWVSIDESQAEIRVALHYAKLLNLSGAEECTQQYVNDPATDYHRWVSELTGMNRKEAKTITFAILYGAGVAKIAEELGVDKERAREILDLYNKKLTFAKPLSDKCRFAAQSRGFIKTIIGRRSRFNLYGPPIWEKGIIPKDHGSAIREFGVHVQRYFLHKALNALIQGSCADVHKLSLRDLYKKNLPLCILPIHDEMNFSVCDMGDVAKIKDTILDSYKLGVPRQVTVKKGISFGELI